MVSQGTVCDHLSNQTGALQDLVEELSREKTWWTPNKLSQQTYDRNAQGDFAAYEEEVHLVVYV